MNRAFYAWLAGASLSTFGDAAVFFALGWAATGIAPHVAGLVLTAYTLPRAVLLLAGGVLGDRVGPRRLLLSGYSLLAVATFALAAAVHFAGTSTALLLLIAFIIGTVDAFTLPAAGAFPRMFARDAELSKALALRTSTNQLINLTAGPVNGLLVAAAGLVGALLVDATTFAVAVAILLATNPPYRISPPEPQNAFKQATDGLRLASSDPVLRPLLLTVALVAGFVLPVTSLGVPLLARSHNWSASEAGLILGATVTGSLLITLTVARLGTFPRPGRTVASLGNLAGPGLAAAAGCLLAAAGIAALAFAPSPVLAAGAGLLQGLGVGLFSSHLAPMFIEATPASHLTRLQSILVLAQTVPLLVTTNLLPTVTAPHALLTCATATTLAAALLLITCRPKRTTLADPVDLRIVIQ